jgi:hypothetical protein
MTINNSTRAVNRKSLLLFMLAGGGIALALIVLFISGVEESDPSWSKYWMVRPFVVLPLAGATGGAFFYFMHHVSHRGGWSRALAYCAGVLVYIIGLWMGTVIGLNGTLWN